jgi:hypothetical protein
MFRIHSVVDIKSQKKRPSEEGLFFCFRLTTASTSSSRLAFGLNGCGALPHATWQENNNISGCESQEIF